MDEYDSIKARIKTMKEPRRERLRIGLCPSMLAALGPDCISDSIAYDEDFDISIEESKSQTLLNALRRETLDLAVLAAEGRAQDLNQRPFLEEDFVFVTGPQSIPNEETICFTDALRHKLVLSGQHSAHRNKIDTEAHRLSLEPYASFETNSSSVLKAVVARGQAAAIVPYSAVLQDLRANTLHARRIVEPSLTRTIQVVRRKENSAFSADAPSGALIDRLTRQLVTSIGPWGRSLL